MLSLFHQHLEQHHLSRVRPIPPRDLPLVCMYDCMVITYSKGKGQLGKVADPARGQLKRENEYFPVLVGA